MVTKLKVSKKPEVIIEEYLNIFNSLERWAFIKLTSIG